MEQERTHLNHVTWECKYHVVFTPKYRKKSSVWEDQEVFGTSVSRSGASERVPDRKWQTDAGSCAYADFDTTEVLSVAEIIGYMKGKSSIWIAQNVERKARNFVGHKFWARGYFVTTVGRDEEMIRAYIKNQELADQQLDQLEMKLTAS